jgi:hypothetical protein
MIDTKKNIKYPIFYPSVSCVSKNILSPLQHIEILVSISHPQFLVSAYDLYNMNESERKCFEELIPKIKEQNQTIMLDSGIYEKTWRIDNNWNFDKFLSVTNDFCGDIPLIYDEFDKNLSKDQYIESIIQRSENNKYCPIVHWNVEGHHIPQQGHKYSPPKIIS